MTDEERWVDAVEAESSAPSVWSSSAEQFALALRQRLANAGCSWADLAVVMVLARGRSGLDRAHFGERLGVSEEVLRALEGD